MSLLVKQSESVAARRRMYFHCVDITDGMTPETGETGGQPQISVNGGSWANTTNTLTAIGNGRYYVELTAASVGTLGVIEGRYKSANTAESLGSTLQVIAHDPYEDIGLTIRNQLGAAKCTVEAGSSTTLIQIGAMSPSYRDAVGSFDSFVDGLMFFLTGNCAGEFKRITVFTGEDSGHWNVAVASAFSTAPATSDTCILLPACDAATLLAIKAKTDNLPETPAAVGSEMTLANEAITSAKFDESTAFPLKAADTAATQIARVGADGDTLETISDQVDLQATLAICSETRLARLDATVSSRAPESGGNVAAIKAKTDNLPTDPADDSDIDTQLAVIAGYIDTEVAAVLAAVDSEVAAIKAKTDNLPADPASETNVNANETKIDAIDAVVDAIKAKTDNLPAAPADDTSIDSQLGAIQTDITAITGYVDTEVAAVLAAVDTEVAAIKAKTDNLPADPASETNINANETKIDAIDAVVDAVKVVTDKVATALELDGAVYRYTANALEQAPSGGATVAQIADGVWDEAAGDHVAAGSMGKKLNDVTGGAAVNIQHDSTVIVTDS